jgi:hypothetical protein
MAYKVKGKPLAEASMAELSSAWIQARSIRMRATFEWRDAASAYETALLEEIERRAPKHPKV